MLSIITPGSEIDMFLPEGFYSDEYQLMDRCNGMIERNLKDAGTIVDTKFTYDATSRKISVHVGADNVVTLSSDLASIMGFHLGSWPLTKKECTWGKSLWTRTEDSIVYTSIAMWLKQYQWAPLLRVVDAVGNFGDTIHRLYMTPQYVPVSKKEFNTVEIDIRDDTGRAVPFEFGKVITTLHFRRSWNKYFLS